MATRLIFVRHGEAAGGNFPGGDADRPLTPHGQAQAEAVARALAASGVRLERLFSSPLVRARETARALTETGLAENVEICPELLPERGTGPLLELISALPTDRTYAFVGHEPLLSEAVETLLFARPYGALALGKGSVCVLERGQETWRLVALLSTGWFLPTVATP